MVRSALLRDGIGSTAMLETADLVGVYRHDARKLPLI